jgi:hypothetical protein
MEQSRSRSTSIRNKRPARENGLSQDAAKATGAFPLFLKPRTVGKSKLNELLRKELEKVISG